MPLLVSRPSLTMPAHHGHFFDSCLLGLLVVALTSVSVFVGTHQNVPLKWITLIVCKLYPSTVGSWIMLFCSSFCYNINEKEKTLIPSWDHCLWGLQVLSMSAWVFSRVSGFLPHLKDVCIRLIDVFILSQSEWMWVALWWKGVLSRVGPALRPDRAARRGPGHLWPWTRISRLKNNYLVIIHLKCMCSSPLFQYLILEVF